MINEQEYQELKSLFVKARRFLNNQIDEADEKGTYPIDQSLRQIELLTTIIGVEIADRYIEHRIQADKVLEGILKDIQNNINEITMHIGCINEVGLTINERN